MPVPPNAARRWTRRRLTLVLVLAAALVAGGVTVTAAVTADDVGPTTRTALQRWLAAPELRIAHRGGDADWPEASPAAYRDAAAWNPDLALEFPARRTADGVWVASEDATTQRVFGRDLIIADTTWAQLSTLRSTVGGQPMARLQQDVLDVVSRDRILFVDDKDDAYAGELLDLLDHYGGRDRTVVKAYCGATVTPAAARKRGYTTWGYWYPSDMPRFATTEQNFDLLGLRYDAPAADWRAALATGKRVVAHIVATEAQAQEGRAAGATGLMVSGVREVVPQG